MKKVISMLAVAALAVFGNVEAKPVEHPVMHPIAHPTNPELEKPKFERKRHHKHHRHHVRPHRHGKRHHHPHCKFGRKPINAPIVHPVRKIKK